MGIEGDCIQLTPEVGRIVEEFRRKGDDLYPDDLPDDLPDGLKIIRKKDPPNFLNYGEKPYVNQLFNRENPDREELFNRKNPDQEELFYKKNPDALTHPSGSAVLAALGINEALDLSYLLEQ